MRTLFKYADLPALVDSIRAKYHNEIINTIMDDKDKYHADIHEMIDYFITELDSSDFIRLVEKIKQKRIV